ncbi:hypothetical protein [Arcticibacter sp. MXS-1]|uniref:hypothetical protein n=1 Tax=Arcticibacter sp. MXS-1 TaxID=3341726 RepID=UPI0035A8C9E8
MNKNPQIADGATLKYKGKGFENFDPAQPFMKFLGYDSYGWSDVWVEYQGNSVCVSAADVEVVQEGTV